MHTLKSIKTRKVQRVGRGGKRGTTSGRGQKGQKSRSGRKMRPASRDLLLRLPKKRGFRNKPTSNTVTTILLSRLGKKCLALSGKGAATVTPDTLKTLGIVRGTTGLKNIKVIGSADISCALHISGMKVTKGAKAAIEKAGGKVE